VAGNGYPGFNYNLNQDVDKLIAEVRAAVAAIGETDNTYIVFSSDNGYHMGEHRLMPGKMTAYDTDIHVPLVITGPGIPVGLIVDQIVENIDLHSTFAELGGAAPSRAATGRSLAPLWRGQRMDDWRLVALIEHRGPHREAMDPDLPRPRSGNPPSYEALRTTTSLYVEYVGGDREYHDLTTDPHELHNTFSSLTAEKAASVHAALEALKTCRDPGACRAAERGNGDVGAR